MVRPSGYAGVAVARAVGRGSGVKEGKADSSGIMVLGAVVVAVVVVVWNDMVKSEGESECGGLAFLLWCGEVRWMDLGLDLDLVLDLDVDLDLGRRRVSS